MAFQELVENDLTRFHVADIIAHISQRTSKANVILKAEYFINSNRGIHFEVLEVFSMQEEIWI